MQNKNICTASTNDPVSGALFLARNAQLDIELTGWRNICLSIITCASALLLKSWAIHFCSNHQLSGDIKQQSNMCCITKQQYYSLPPSHMRVHQICTYTNLLAADAHKDDEPWFEKFEKIMICTSERISCAFFFYKNLNRFFSLCWRCNNCSVVFIF